MDQLFEAYLLVERTFFGACLIIAHVRMGYYVLARPMSSRPTYGCAQVTLMHGASASQLAWENVKLFASTMYIVRCLF